MPKPLPKAEVVWFAPQVGPSMRTKRGVARPPAGLLSGPSTWATARPCVWFASRPALLSWGTPGERPQEIVEIKVPFWMGQCEVTNRQYSRFDPEHDSRFEHRTSWIFSEDYLGWPLDGPEQPVVRVSCDRAAAFCQWLSEQTGLDVQLPRKPSGNMPAVREPTHPFPSAISTVISAVMPTWPTTPCASWPTRAGVRAHPISFRATIVSMTGISSPLRSAAFSPTRGGCWTCTATCGNGPDGLAARFRQQGRDRPAGNVVRGGSGMTAQSGPSLRSTCPTRVGQRVFNVGFRVVCSEKTIRVAAVTASR